MPLAPAPAGPMKVAGGSLDPGRDAPTGTSIQAAPPGRAHTASRSGGCAWFHQASHRLPSCAPPARRSRRVQSTENSEEPPGHPAATGVESVETRENPKARHQRQTTQRRLEPRLPALPVRRRNLDASALEEPPVRLQCGLGSDAGKSLPLSFAWAIRSALFACELADRHTDLMSANHFLTAFVSVAGLLRLPCAVVEEYHELEDMPGSAVERVCAA